MASFREQRAEERKQQILRTAAELFHTKGYQSTTIEEIANELKLTKGSLYYYVNGKEDLLFQCHNLVAQSSIDRLRTIVDSSLNPGQKLSEAVRHHVYYECEEISMFNVIEKPAWISSLEIRSQILKQRDEYESIFQQIIAEGIKSGVFAPVDLKLFRLFLLGTLNSISRWYSPTGKYSKEEIADSFVTYILGSLSVNPDVSPSIRFTP